MPSPFPGMNPYFERAGIWRGFHNRFLVYLQDAIAEVLDPHYYVEYEESLYIDDADERSRLFAVADVTLVEKHEAEVESHASDAFSAPVMGTILRTSRVRRKRRWLTIRDAANRKIVTVIEMFSPSDKSPGRNRTRYLAKRERILDSSAHLVEIDFLRGGQRMPIQGLPASDYLIAVSRQWERPRVGLWPFDLRQPIAPLYVPLSKKADEFVLDLKPVLDRDHDGARYGSRIYDGPPEPPLSVENAAWAKGLIASFQS